MRLATIQTPHGPRAAVLHGNCYIDLHATDPALPTSVRAILEEGPAALSAADKAARCDKTVAYDAASVKLLPPVPDPRKIVCIGLNYRDHAAETDVPIPKEPVLFSKYATALIGHGEPILLPPVSKEVDFEAELVLVVGKRGRFLDPDTAVSYLAGYTIGHDVSARDWQLKRSRSSG